MNHASIPTSLAAFALTACAGTPLETIDTATNYDVVQNPGFEAIARAESDVERDRRAILAMQGDYRVDFNFTETVPLKAGYEKHDDKTTGGYETVIVVEDSPDRIVLQHLLVSPGGHVIKHWRQDWYFEAKERFEFVADQEWAIRALAPEKTAGAWTQCVFEVSDAPRYCGTGKWNHRYGVSTWTSDRTWRPLPRREYTRRDDYNAINAENRHTVTPHGWTHEQDNTKTVRDGRKTEAILVREFGFNDYRNIDGYDFSPAMAYWERTGDYWALVRQAWHDRMQSGTTLRLLTDVDGMPIIEGTFEQAEQAANLSQEQQLQAIDELLSEWSESAKLLTRR